MASGMSILLPFAMGAVLAIPYASASLRMASGAFRSYSFLASP